MKTNVAQALRLRDHIQDMSALQKKHDQDVRHSSTIKQQYRHLNVVRFQMIRQYGYLSLHVL